MRHFFILACAFFSCSLFAYSSDFRDYDFQQDRMLIAEDGIYIISSFEDYDGVSAYSHYGDSIWETRFFAKIISWQVLGDRIIVFSKHRRELTTYLTCLNRYTGKKIWQRP